MSEEAVQNEPVDNTEATTETQTGKTYTEAEVQQMINEQVSGLKSKVEELLGEKKTVAQKAKELEEEQQRAQEERMKEKQQFKELYEKEQQAKQELAEKFETFQQRIQRQEMQSASQRIASELTRDSARAELLTEKAMQYANYNEDQVTFELGGVPVEASKLVEHLKEKYPFLADGSGATGGGASGSQNGGAVTNKSFAEMSGAELSELRAENPNEYQRLRNEYYGQ
jgi:DNA repair exonuclease SbcCD ATPase subunit